MASPKRLVIVAGTGTEIGKTWAGQRLLERARVHGWRVAARKPAQSFAPGSGATDAELLAAASGESPDEVCPRHRWYPVAMAPPIAADVLDRPPITLNDLISEIRWPDSLDLGLIETAGGLRSPLTHDADNLALIQRLNPTAVLLVANAGLGTINLVRLSVGALAGISVVVLLNHFNPGDDVHRRNRNWLAARDELNVVTTVDRFSVWLEQGPGVTRQNR